jgi:hypothetical protein
MAHDLSYPDATRFGLTQFADVLPPRDPIIGETPGSFEEFSDGMMQSLAPMTSYECVIAENLISIEWELVQHHAMRHANLREMTRQAIVQAFVTHRENEHDTYWVHHHDEKLEQHKASGGTDADLEWGLKMLFDDQTALAEGEALARDAVSQDLETRTKAHETITALGMDPVQVMSAAYRTQDTAVTHHDMKISELERRRREVKRDYDLLQKSRPFETVEGKARAMTKSQRPRVEIEP